MSSREYMCSIKHKGQKGLASEQNQTKWLVGYN